MRIGDLATRTQVSVRALRYYEEQGLLVSTRSESGQRKYGDSAVNRVRLIQQLYGAGLSSKTIADLLPCVDAGVSTPESRERLAVERDRINTRIAELVIARNKLDDIIDATSRPNPECDYV
ncbi:MerR family transcriptional regulator [Actinoplanes sp. OR16]|uniref:MerR family transcriptional regulator n=1 Tax=Actinoplanes sp. OR16 TaxID=946334 RepID=UPI000F6FEF1D|nr:MerR family transcriptional regulator [Actinoplanes sp. OR16]BBH66665.1 MerR family transcriptional regulator [Actinoplanes sp. OR16]